VRHLLNAAKIGHGGTLDPLASGVLPLALGEATKTVQFAMDGRKEYDFLIEFGSETESGDAEGMVIRTSTYRPTDVELQAALAPFTGIIQQRPPAYAAIKVEGTRAYALARAGQAPEMASRAVMVHSLTLLDRPDADHALLRVECGKGTYVRALARDIAAAVGGAGHVSQLRRRRVGGFTLQTVKTLDELAELVHESVVKDVDAAMPRRVSDLSSFLLPVETALDDIPAVAITHKEAQRLRLGQSISLMRRSDLVRLQAAGFDWRDERAEALAVADGVPVALARFVQGSLQPVRILNLT
jgi:tRNA pseudouridine55 synthase